jgi:YesN/AraC family two-component response regulator
MKLTLTAIKSLFQKKAKKEGKPSAGLLTAEQAEQIQKSMDDFWSQTRPYLKHRYSLHDLSNETGVPIHRLSAFFNKEKKMNFNDFVNSWRIRYCLEFLQRSEIKKINLAELSSLCGFNNRNSFSDAFKKFTGQNPSVYIKNLK